jgi:1-acyl-sn-glycerol-3-phosphate acyltransferase
MMARSRRIDPTMQRRWRRALRLLMLTVHLVLGAVVVALVYSRVSREARLGLRARWCRRVLRVLGVGLEVVGTPPPGCHLIAANHISWLDAFVIGAVFPSWFLAKSEVRAWPFTGWMAAANDTLFLRRRSARAVYRMNAEIRTRLDARQSVVVFPEGTTTDGSRVLDFYPALFQPAVDRSVPVLPIAVCYRDATRLPAPAVAYIDDDPLWKSLRAVLDAPRTEACLVLDGILDPAGLKRRDLAKAACAAVRRVYSSLGAAAVLEESQRTRLATMYETANASD